MLSAQTLLTALAVESPEADQRRRRQRVIAILGMIVGLAGIGGAVWVFVQAALYGWATTNWERMTSAQILMYPFLFLTFFMFLSFLLPQRPMLIRTRTLRDAIAQGDERIAPVAPSQPTPLAGSVLAADALEFRALRRLATSSSSQSGFFIIPLLIVPIQLGTAITALPEALGWNLDWFDSPLFWLTLVIPFVCIIAAFVVYFAILIRGPHKRWDVTVSAEGLTWRTRERGGQASSAPWSAIRSFFKAPYRDGTAVGERTAFVVDTGDQVFGWVLGQNSKDGEFTESERLSRTIVTRTGLPLRELSSGLGSLAFRRGATAQPSGLPEGVAAEVTALKKRLLRGALVFVPLFLVLVLVMVAGLQAPDWLQSAQRSYFAGLAPQVYASQQLFYDSLAYDDGQWPVATPNATSVVSRAFAQGSYQVSGGAESGVDVTAALTHPIYSDAAVEVTVRTVGFSDAGLALRAQEDGDLIAFTVNQASGEWALVHYQLSGNVDPSDAYDLLDSGTSAAIHTAPGTTNRLLVVMRGDTYLLYANDHLLDVASQQYDDPTLTQGQVGVFVADAAVTGSFTNFVVYAVQPKTSADWV